MIFHCLDLYTQANGDLFIAQSRFNQRNDLTLPPGAGYIQAVEVKN